MKKFLFVVSVIFLLVQHGFAQSEEAAALESIKNKSLSNTSAIDNISYLADVIGARYSWSPGFRKAADWTMNKFNKYGLDNIHTEEWEPIGKDWEVKDVTAKMTAPYSTQLIAYPKVWSPGTNGKITGRAVYLEANSEPELEQYSGKLKDAIVFITPYRKAGISYQPFVTRFADSTLTELETAVIPDSVAKAMQKFQEEQSLQGALNYFSFFSRKVEFCMQQGAKAVIESGGRIYGTVQSFGAILPQKPADVYDYLLAACKADAPETLPQLTVSAEQYNSIIRAIKSGADVTLELNLDVELGDPDKGFSVFAEIPGNELRNEIVTIGAHLDTQGPSIGATDNGAGVAICMEAINILKQLGIKPKRTIRIALWGGEEEGYYGSKAYVDEHFVNPLPQFKDEACYLYLNTDLGAGRFRGIYMQENEKARPLMQKWLDKISLDKKLITTLNPTSNTDHEAFDEAGLPGFQFIVDQLDYFRIFHTNMDTIERIPEEDLKENIRIMASLAYLAAMSDEEFPRKVSSETK